MPDNGGNTKQPTRPRIRAGKACKRCNQKRIRCDAMNWMPCTNCVQDGIAECTLRESKRGTYTRKFREQDPSECELEGGHAGNNYRDTGLSNTFQSANTVRPPLLSNGGAEIGIDAISGIAGSQSNPILRQTTETQLPAHNSLSTDPVGYDDNNIPRHDDLSPDAQPADRSNTNRARCAERGLMANDSPSNEYESPSDQRTHENADIASSYQDLSWSTMFDYFLHNRRNGREFIDKCSITYLGESFPLAIVLGDVNESGRQKLHHPGPPLPETEGGKGGNMSHFHPSHLMPEDFEHLQAKGVFDFLEKSHLDALVSVFLEHVYPSYPIVSRQELIHQHNNGEVPLILLHSICFIAVTFCPPSVLHLVGLFSRRNARAHFYKKVKALFDSGYEMNKIVILQSAILMSFWGGGPNNYWNFYSWVSTAVTIAEAIGIHRSIATTNMQSQDKSLLRRLWWVLVVRDSVCSALVGRPFRIDMDQSDTEMLTIEDFADDTVPLGFVENLYHQRYALYQINIAKLSLILRDIVMSRFYPGKPAIPSEELHDKLSHWKQAVPSALDWTGETADYQNPFSVSLLVQYNHHLILIYIGHLPDDNICSPKEREREEIASTAAQNISAAACTIVTKSSFLSVPHEVFHGVFMAQAVFYTKLKSPNPLVAQLGRSALNNCQMVLHAICECWDPAPWIMQLFEGLSARCQDRQTSSREQRSHAAMAADSTWFSGILGSTPEAGVFNSLLRDDAWKSNPMLSSLFEMPPDLFLSE
ncbi:hypothetical protein BDV38DRAFT_276875 [Aspergillus pseudotamarii]|uniref:Zn(2)-C6 fungal-type domain-containing protein n=1 Tax=Aspergillus pseudotamarii TaxID=132259 RepID=A0A5N6TBQ5_ASPPS|nr:uncharacterized protein BDV38DRAFT_276875 [Aspergillus pseudotamarii]KAE8143805.1 hypothetical protein BDV38DRAFT_276875 [Aspergillus pseudotamarii]